VRVTVTGAVGLQSGAVPGRPLATEAAITDLAAERSYPSPTALGQFWVARQDQPASRVIVYDRYGDIVIDVAGEVADGHDAETLAATIKRRTRQMGPVTVGPDAWILSGTRIIQVESTELDTIGGQLERTTSAGVSPLLIIGRE